MPRFPFVDWQAQQVRLTVFPMPDSTVRHTEWWQAVTGILPDETSNNPKTGSALVQGAFAPGKLILKLGAERIDWILVPSDDVEELIPARVFPVLGPAAAVTAAFSTIAERWLRRDDVPAISRVAFGSVLMHPEVDRRTGYVQLPDYVPVQVDPDSSDFMYQINLPAVPSATGIEGLRLNRLSKWSVLALKSVALSLTTAAIQTQMTPEAFALLMELDINTVPDFIGPIPHGRLVEVYSELVEAGHRIATEGVVAR